MSISGHGAIREILESSIESKHGPGKSSQKMLHLGSVVIGQRKILRPTTPGKHQRTPATLLTTLQLLPQPPSPWASVLLKVPSVGMLHESHAVL